MGRQTVAYLLLAEAAEKASEHAACPGQGRDGAGCGRQPTRDGLVVVGAGNGIDDLRLVEVVRTFDDGYESDQHAVAHHLCFKFGSVVAIPHCLATSGQSYAHADLVDAFFRDACVDACLLYTSPSPRDRQKSRMPSSA